MNDTFLAFLSDQILPPLATACAVAFFLAILSAFWRSLWDLTAQVGLFALSMLPGVGLVPAVVLDLVYEDKTALAMQGVILFLAAPLVPG
jgi:hypothetical protein